MIIQTPDGRYIHQSKPATPFYRGVVNALRRAFTEYQHLNAVYLHPRQYGQLPHCYATLQETGRHANQPSHSIEACFDLDTLADIMLSLNTSELEALIDRLDATSDAVWAATMSDQKLTQFLASLEGSARPVTKSR